MPLSELYRLAKRRVDSNQDFEPGNDVFELVWQNGQITTTQGQSSRARKDPTGNSLPSHCLPSYTPKSRDKDLVGNGTASSRTGKFGAAVDSAVNEIPLSVPSEEVGLSHDDDDMIPWLNYQIDAPLQAEYCPDFLPELSGVTANEVSKSGNFASSNDKSSCNQVFRESSAVSAGLEQSNVSKVVGGGSIRPRTGSSQLCPASSTQQYQASFLSFRSRGDGLADRAVCSNSGRDSSTDFPSPRIQKQDSLPPGTSTGVINFSHFSRPVALARSNSSLQSMPSMERMSNRDKGGFAANLGNSPPKLGTIDSSSGLRKGPSLQCRSGASSGVDLKQLDGRPIDKPRSGGRDSEAVCRDDASINDASSNRIACESTTRGLPDGEKNTEPVVASSSVCSGNSAERASDDPTHELKRKFRNTEDSECHSEDVEEESVGVKKMGLPRASGSKRSRAAEVHNLSERRRRDRINEKMRALQELIPNCNKVDKASMLEEAIEYLKTLQLQVQIMSMGSGLWMPAMMLPPGLQHVHGPHMAAHFPPMGMGMGLGMGIPDMSGGFQGPHFPGPPVQAMVGHGLQVFGLPGQGISVPMQRPQLVPMMGGPFVKPAVAMNASEAGCSVENTDSGPQSNGANNSSMNQTPSQCQAMNEGFDRSASAQLNANPSDANAGKASTSNRGNDAGPSRSTNYD